MRGEMLWVAGALAVFFSILMSFQKSLYSAAMCLLVVMLQVSLLFSLSGSPLLGLMQMVIYAGAVMVLVVVVIMAFPKLAESRWGDFFIPRPLAILLILGLLAELVLIFYRTPLSQSVSMAANNQPVGSVLFGSYAPATEAATLLMFLAGLALVGKRKES